MKILDAIYQKKTGDEKKPAELMDWTLKHNFDYQSNKILIIFIPYCITFPKLFRR